MPGLKDVLTEVAISVPALQSRLDRFHWAQLQAARDTIHSVAGTPLEPVAHQLVPDRQLAHETVFEFEMSVSHTSETQISATLVNSFFARRYPRRRAGMQKITMTIHSYPRERNTDE
jgi:hypothetical protein